MKIILDFFGGVSAVVGFFTASTVWALAFWFTIRHYARPRISYFKKRVGNKKWLFLVKHFDSVMVDAPLWINVTAPDGIEQLEVAAGPWLSNFFPSAPPNPNPVKMVALHFNGIPAEGVFAVGITTKGSVPVLSIATDSPVQPRAFREARKWENARITPWIFKTTMGFATAAFAYFMGERIINAAVKLFLSESDDFTQRSGLILFGEGLFEFWGILILAWLLALSIFSYVLTSPFSGKETIRGYLGNRVAGDDLAHVWPLGAKATPGAQGPRPGELDVTDPMSV